MVCIRHEILHHCRDFANAKRQTSLLRERPWVRLLEPSARSLRQQLHGAALAVIRLHIGGRGQDEPVGSRRDALLVSDALVLMP